MPKLLIFPATILFQMIIKAVSLEELVLTEVLLCSLQVLGRSYGKWVGLSSARRESEYQWFLES